MKWRKVCYAGSDVEASNYKLQGVKDIITLGKPSDILDILSTYSITVTPNKPSRFYDLGPVANEPRAGGTSSPSPHNPATSPL